MKSLVSGAECMELTNDDVHVRKEDDFLFYIESWGQLEPRRHC